MTKSERDALRKLSEAATFGCWQYRWSDGSGECNEKEGGSISACDEGEPTVVMGGDHDGCPVGVLRECDAHFIEAADPNTVLSLLDEVDRLEKALEQCGPRVLKVLDSDKEPYMISFAVQFKDIRKLDVPELAQWLRERQ